MRVWMFEDARPPGYGPWNDEPDKAQWIDESTDLDCLIVRNNAGALCGYVGVPPGHPWHGRAYEQIEPWPHVHGGLTFAGFCREGGENMRAICHVPEPGRPDRVWWLGFDCAHAGDLAPTHNATLVKIGAYPQPGAELYRTFDYVREECAELAEQVKAAE